MEGVVVEYTVLSLFLAESELSHGVVTKDPVEALRGPVEGVPTFDSARASRAVRVGVASLDDCAKEGWGVVPGDCCSDLPCFIKKVVEFGLEGGTVCVLQHPVHPIEQVGGVFPYQFSYPDSTGFPFCFCRFPLRMASLRGVRIQSSDCCVEQVIAVAEGRSNTRDDGTERWTDLLPEVEPSDDPCF